MSVCIIEISTVLEGGASFPTRPTKSTYTEEKRTLFGKSHHPRVFYPLFNYNAVRARPIRATHAHPDLVPLRPGNISSISVLETAPKMVSGLIVRMV